MVESLSSIRGRFCTTLLPHIEFCTTLLLRTEFCTTLLLHIEFCTTLLLHIEFLLSFSCSIKKELHKMAPQNLTYFRFRNVLQWDTPSCHVFNLTRIFIFLRDLESISCNKLISDYIMFLISDTET